MFDRFEGAQPLHILLYCTKVYKKQRDVEGAQRDAEGGQRDAEGAQCDADGAGRCGAQ